MMEIQEIRLNIINNIFNSAVGNERLRILEIAQEQYEWVMKVDNAKKAPAAVTKTTNQGSKRG